MPPFGADYLLREAATLDFTTWEISQRSPISTILLFRQQTLQTFFIQYPGYIFYISISIHNTIYLTSTPRIRTLRL